MPYGAGDYDKDALSADHRHFVALDESELYANVTNMVTGNVITLDLETVTGVRSADSVHFDKTNPNLIVVEDYDTAWQVDIRTPDELGEAIAFTGTSDTPDLGSTVLPDYPDADHGTNIKLADGTVWNFGMIFNVNGSDVVFRASSLAPGATEWEVGEKITMAGLGSAGGANVEHREDWWAPAPVTGSGS